MRMLAAIAMTLAVTSAEAEAPDLTRRPLRASSGPEAAIPLRPVRVEGRVTELAGEHLTLMTRQGRAVHVDLRNVPDIAKALLTFGRDVEVSGFARSDGVVLAHAVEVDYGDLESASP